VLLSRRVLAELVGTAFLVLAVVGSGIAAQRLTPDIGVQLLINAVATAGALVAILLALGPVHINPVVSAVDALLGGVGWRDVAAYVPAQVLGGCGGAVVANLMYGRSAVSLSHHARGGPGQLLGEVVATFGLLLVAFGVVRSGRAAMAPFAVAAYIGGAYFFTSSTSFANPAVTVARTLSDTFAGIGAASVAGFVGAQAVGAALAWPVVRRLYP
jgi:arsenate reductase